MLKRLLTTGLTLCALSLAHAQTVTPIVQPRVSFVDDKGKECAGCKLYSYSAGSTTPLATYTDATGGSQNTNPITLDPSGSATIWLGKNSYKFILKDTTGTTLWTVDLVDAAHSFPSAPAYSIQFANSTASRLSSDSTIKIDPTAHTINVGTVPTTHFTLNATGTPTSWTMNVASPATARTSLGTGQVASGTTGQVAVYPGAGTTVQGATALPNGITATTQSASDSSTKVATTAYVAAPGAIGPTSVAVNGGTAVTDNQGNGAKVQHSTGSTTTGHGAIYDANGNVVDAGWVAAAPPTYNIIARVTGSCVLSDDGSGGSGCISDIPWVVTMPANYYAWCAVNAMSGSTVWHNHTSVSIVGTPPLSGTIVTFALDNQQSVGRGSTAYVTCWATN